MWDFWVCGTSGCEDSGCGDSGCRDLVVWEFPFSGFPFWRFRHRTTRTTSLWCEIRSQSSKRYNCDRIGGLTRAECSIPLTIFQLCCSWFPNTVRVSSIQMPKFYHLILFWVSYWFDASDWPSQSLSCPILWMTCWFFCLICFKEECWILEPHLAHWRNRPWPCSWKGKNEEWIHLLSAKASCPIWIGSACHSEWGICRDR